MASLTRSLRLSSPRRRTTASIRFNSSDPILVATVTSVIRQTTLVYHGKPIFQSSGPPDDGQSACFQIRAWSLGRWERMQVQTPFFMKGFHFMGVEASGRRRSATACLWDTYHYRAARPGVAL